MPSSPFAHVCMVVRDLDTAIKDWTKILRVLDPGQLEERIVKYDEFSSGDDAGMKWATFVNNYGTEIQFIQPGPGTPLGKRLDKVGEHVHHLCFSTDDLEGDMAKMGEDPKTQEWWDVCGPMQAPYPNRAEGEWWMTLREVFQRQISADTASRQDHDVIFDPLKKAVIDEAMNNHEWDSKAMDYLVSYSHGYLTENN